MIALAPDHDPLMSEESAAILTMPSDFPSSPPTNLQVVPLDSNRISVSWEPPLYPNAPLVSYLLTIHQISSEIGETFHSSQVSLPFKLLSDYIPMNYLYQPLNPKMQHDKRFICLSRKFHSHR